MKKRMLALLTALVLLTLTACGSGAAKASETPAPVESASPAETAAPETAAPETTPAGELPTVAPSKYDPAFAAFDPDAVVMTINGQDVVWNDYFYCIAAIGRIFDQSAPFTDWQSELGSGYTYQSYAMEYAENSLKQYVTVEQKAREEGLTLDENDQAEIEAMRQSDMAGFSGEEEFAVYLSGMYLTPAFYQRVLEDSRYYIKLFDKTFGEGGEKLSDEDARSYIEDNGYMRAKHILFNILDPEGAEVSAEEKEKIHAHALEILGVLQAIADPQERLTRFDELMFTWSEDTGLISFPDGYCFTPGTMVPAFEDAVLSLEDYGMTDELVESRFGYHIILRLPIDLDETKDMDGYPLRYVAASEIFAGMADDWFDQAEIVYTPEFADLDFNTIFVSEQAEK